MPLLPNAYGEVFTMLENAGCSRVTGDVRNVAPPCILVDPPAVRSINSNLATLDVPISVIGTPPATQQCITEMLTRADPILAWPQWLIVDAKPTVQVIGQQELPAYTVTIRFDYSTDEV